MRATLLSLIFIGLCLNGQSQGKLKFQLNLLPLVEEELLSPSDSISVYIRGSFNNWQGSDYKLEKEGGDHLYTGTFDLEGNAGDTLSYKFVIDKGHGKFFWEGQADPGNPDNGNRRIVLAGSDQVLPVALFHANEYFSYPVVFKKEKLQADFRQFRSILENTHPALYDYTDKSVLDSLFDCKYAAIQNDMEFSSFLILMTEVISRVGCGHSSLWVPGDYWSVAPPGLFPLKLLVSGTNYYVSGTFAGPDDGSAGMVPVGSVIETINGVPFEKITDRLESLSSTDGLNQAFRRAKVAQNFSVKYSKAYGFPETFKIQYLPPGGERPVEAELHGVSKEEVDRGNMVNNELTLTELKGGKVALLTINSFAYYSEVPMFRSFIDSVFQVIDDRRIDKLILDLRGNGGGDPFCSSYLWGYLQDEALPYFEDHYGRYDTLANPIPLPVNHFSGDLYTLVDGLGFSTTGHFCGLLKYHRVGKFVGSETGATYTCTGNATYPALKETGIMVGTARVMRYTAAVKDMDPLHGILPDFPVEITQEDLINGRDAVMEFALRLANGK